MIKWRMNNFLGRNIHCGVGVCGSFSKSCRNNCLCLYSRSSIRNATRTTPEERRRQRTPSSQYPPQKRPFSPSLPRNVSSEHFLRTVPQNASEQPQNTSQHSSHSFKCLGTNQDEDEGEMYIRRKLKELYSSDQPRHECDGRRNDGRF